SPQPIGSCKWRAAVWRIWRSPGLRRCVDVCSALIARSGYGGLSAVYLTLSCTLSWILSYTSLWIVLGAVDRQLHLTEQAVNRAVRELDREVLRPGARRGPGTDIVNPLIS